MLDTYSGATRVIFVAGDPLISRLGGLAVGPGGFIDIAQNAHFRQHDDGTGSLSGQK